MTSGSEHDKVRLRLLCIAASIVLCCSVSLTTAQQTSESQQASTSRKRVPIAAMRVAYVDVPDVRGLNLDDAKTRLQGAGLPAGNISYLPGPGVVGTVWQQTPEANTAVARGTSIDLVITAAQKQKRPVGSEVLSRQVPDLLGLTPNQASDRLMGSRIFLGNVSTGTGGGQPGTIYAQTPQAGSLVRLGSKIDVEVVQEQKKPPKKEVVWVYVPNLVGQSEATAEQMLPSFGLTLGDVSHNSASVPVGTVFAQYPLPRSRVLQGAQVSLQVAEAPQQEPTIATVPNLIQRNLKDAESALSQSGLRLGEVRTEEMADVTPDSVTGQSPEPGTRVARGTQVNVVIAQEIPLVEVPDLVDRRQADASAILDSLDLRLGAIDEREANAESGTILSQTPAAHEMVRSGTAVNVTLSRYVVRGLTLMLGGSAPKKGKPLRLHAELEPPGKGAEYRFDFGDGTQSDWLQDTDTIHVYKAGGDFHAKAFARLGDTTTVSDTVTIPIREGALLGILITIGGIAILGGGGFVYHGWRMFQASIRIVPHPVIGTQVVYTANGGDRGEAVRLRVIEGESECSVQAAKAR